MSSKDWKKYKFSEFVNINPTISLKGSNLLSYIEMKDLSEGKRYVMPSDEKKLTGGARFREKNVLFARITPCLENGKIGQAQHLKNGVGFGSTEFLVFDSIPEVSDQDFIYYLACWQEVRRFAKQNMIGTSGRQRVNKEAFDKLELFLPNLSTQKRIAGILSSLDDKIANNLAMNQTLEEIAQTIFKHWFVHFNYPEADGKRKQTELGEIPADWEIKPLDEIANFLNGLALQKYPVHKGDDFLPVIKIKELKNGITDSTDKANLSVPEKYIIQDGDLLFSWSATLLVKFWNYGKGALNQHLFKVNSEKFPLWFCYLQIQHHLDNFKKIAYDKTTTIGHIQRRHLTEALCLIPNNLVEMGKVFQPILDKIIANEQQNQTLRQIRDSLLPKLMSGEIAINHTKP